MRTAVLAMEDRKRPVPHEPSDDSLPPFKRPALNSASSSQAPQNSHQVPQSQEDVIHFQKEAIWRQMMEYKRERNMLESRVEELDKRSTYHDDHLRVIDAWWAQFDFLPASPIVVIRMELPRNFPPLFFSTI
ncbi:hypothetical protein L873DRAFT_532712 [Choiromyces venosus 120613-1]|uniref:E3 ubiquitin protein ligase n=1 Tax=Choiromyces venosus 120613-1 TaxID=1336337 RepID=A0A3N4K5P9_9PEZI|nr:hypothetical protein L873DRAFT_532712 [Choiromyces venosus 120613-1]